MSSGGKGGEISGGRGTARVKAQRAASAAEAKGTAPGWQPVKAGEKPTEEIQACLKEQQPLSGKERECESTLEALT